MGQMVFYFITLAVVRALSKEDPGAAILLALMYILLELCDVNRHLQELRYLRKKK